MKYRILLAGNNVTVINDFFSHLNENIEPMTTSQRFEDIVAHLRYFKPDAFCYCAANERQEHINQVPAIKMNLNREKIAFVLIGSEEDLNEFTYVTSDEDLILQKPITAAMIEERLIKFIDELHYQEQQQLEEERRQEEEAKKARRRHILVIDDDSTMLKTIKEQLHEEYDIATALSGKIGLKFLEKKKTDLILLDYEMPVETGPMVLEKLRENKDTKNIPVIFLTGVTETEKIKQVLAMKPQGYILKPIERDKLVKAIQNILPGES